MASRSRVLRLRPESPPPRFVPPRARCCTRPLRCCTRPLTRPAARFWESLRFFLPTSASFDLDQPSRTREKPGVTRPRGFLRGNGYLTVREGIHPENGARMKRLTRKPTRGGDDDRDG